MSQVRKKKSTPAREQIAGKVAKHKIAASPTARKQNKRSIAPPLFTIGYEKARPQALLDELKKAKVQLLVDTRAVAASRRPGFSQRQLSASLDENGIGYLHLQKLGTPAEGRKANHAGDMKRFWQVYEKQLRTPEAKSEMEALLALVRSGQRICLLCYERDASQCHRQRIAEIVRAHTGVSVENLVPPLF